MLEIGHFLESLRKAHRVDVPGAVAETSVSFGGTQTYATKRVFELSQGGFVSVQMSNLQSPLKHNDDCLNHCSHYPKSTPATSRWG